MDSDRTWLLLSFAGFHPTNICVGGVIVKRQKTRYRSLSESCHQSATRLKERWSMHSHYGVETNKTLLFIRHSVAFHRISIRLDGPNDTIALGDGLGQNDGAQAASGFHGKRKVKKRCGLWGSNSRPRDYETRALPTEPKPLHLRSFSLTLVHSIFVFVWAYVSHSFFYVFLIATHCILSLGVC